MGDISTTDIVDWQRPPRRTKILLVPGDIVYDHLKKTDPQRLERLMQDEKRRFAETHALDYEQRFHEKVQAAQERVEQLQKRGPDYKLLGFDQFEGLISRQRVVAAYRRAAKQAHPDVGGSDVAMKDLTAAYQRVLAGLRGKSEEK